MDDTGTINPKEEKLPFESEFDSKGIEYKHEHDNDNDCGYTWSESGPPTHWALSSPSALKGITTCSSTSSSSSSTTSCIKNKKDCKEATAVPVVPAIVEKEEVPVQVLPVLPCYSSRNNNNTNNSDNENGETPALLQDQEEVRKNAEAVVRNISHQLTAIDIDVYNGKDGNEAKKSSKHPLLFHNFNRDRRGVYNNHDIVFFDQQQQQREEDEKRKNKNKSRNIIVAAGVVGAATAAAAVGIGLLVISTGPGGIVLLSTAAAAGAGDIVAASTTAATAASFTAAAAGSTTATTAAAAAASATVGSGCIAACSAATAAAAAGVGTAAAVTVARIISTTTNGNRRLIIIGNTGGKDKNKTENGNTNGKQSECDDNTNNNNNYAVGFERANITITVDNDKEWEELVYKLKKRSLKMRQDRRHIFHLDLTKFPMKMKGPCNNNTFQGRRHHYYGPQLKFGRRQYRHAIQDADIIHVEDRELKTEDKIFLLVSRKLNDKKSMPSIVYWGLIAELIDRHFKREVKEEEEKEKDILQIQQQEPKAADRSTRQDLHAINKHIAATLLETTPQLRLSKSTRELATSCVEALVLSQTYNVVFREIVRQTQDDDQLLKKKLWTFYEQSNNRNCSSGSGSYCQHGGSSGCSTLLNSNVAINQTAIDALKSIPDQRTVSGKLRCCVDVLTAISNSYYHQMKTKHKHVTSDWLLEVICWHIVYASVEMSIDYRDDDDDNDNDSCNRTSTNWNAECLFLEEFATDEQLLRGIEGYALITILACISFLNTTPHLLSSNKKD